MHQKERLFGWIGRGRDREADKSYLFLGRPEAVESLCRLGLENNLKIDFVVADESNKPDGHLDPSLSVKTYDYVMIPGHIVMRKCCTCCLSGRNIPGYG